MEQLAFSYEMGAVLALLGLTVFLFVSEILRVDVAALTVLVLLGLLSTLPGLDALADRRQLFDGFASNAVISIIAITIIGAALDRAGLMERVAAWILRYGGTTERRVVPILTGAVSFVSSFMQNVGAAALFLPVAGRVADRTGVALSRLLMPIGFGAILGGTVTMIGTSPLIILNDLIAAANAELPEELRMAPFGLFSVTPVGLSLVAAGILYFTFFGRWVLPGRRGAPAPRAVATAEWLHRTYGLRPEMTEIVIPEGSSVSGTRMEEVMDRFGLYIVGASCTGQRLIAPDIATRMVPPCRLVVMGAPEAIAAFCDEYGLRALPALEDFAEEFSPTRAGVAEIVVPPGSPAIGKTPRELRFRASYGLSPLAIFRGGETLSRMGTDGRPAVRISAEPLAAGDALAVHGAWDSLARMKRENRDFVVVSTGFPEEEARPHKAGWALFFFALALGLVLFTDLRLSLCLMTGAVGMVLSRVLSMDEAYRAVSWKTVFLLGSLIPLGMAVQNTGTAAWIARQVVTMLDGWPVWTLQTGIALLATAFSLVMSNVGATVLLVPLAVSIAAAAGADPAVFALTVGVTTSNSFIIPTHQVNALVMGPGGYRVRDYLRAGGVMTVLFLVVSQTALALFY